ncbi:hypothetical protein VCV18_006614 [Metarhizium anisopliae]
MPQQRLELKFVTLLAAAKEEPMLIIVTWDKFGVVFSVHFALVMTAAAQLLRPIDCRLGAALGRKFLGSTIPVSGVRDHGRGLRAKSQELEGANDKHVLQQSY